MPPRFFNSIALLALLAACASPTPPPAATPTPSVRPYPLPPRMRSPEYGIQVFLWWTIDGKTADNDVRLVRDMGFGWIKQKFNWFDIELAPGEYDWQRADWIVTMVEKYGLKLLIRLDGIPPWAKLKLGDAPEAEYTPVNVAEFADYCGAVATRYRGRIAAYEVWNEPNLAREWAGQPPNPPGYVALLKACYLALKAADPQASLISAGMAPTGTDDPAVAMPDDKFLRLMYEAGAAPYFDLLGVHAPGYMNPPERSPAETEADPELQARWITFRRTEDLRALMVEYGDGAKQVAITEMGWTTDSVNPGYSWYAVTQEQQADYLVRAYQFAKENWSPWIGLMSMIYITDPFWTEDDEQYWWAITRPVPPGDPPVVLPAYEALKAMEK
jgi:hypothetical protein